MKQIFLLILVAGCMATGCTTINQPVFKRIESLALKSFNTDGIELESKFIVENNNAFDIKIMDANIDVFIDNANVGKLSIKEPFTLYANTESVAHCIIKVNASSGAKFGIKTIGKISRGEMPVVLKGSVGIKSNLIKRTIDIDTRIN